MNRAVAAWAAALAFCSGIHAAPSEGNWASEYPRVAAQAQHDCAAPRLESCRTQLLAIYDMLDRRPDVNFRLARVDARLGHSAEAIRRLELYARSQLDFGDPAELPEFAPLREDARFASIESAWRASRAATGHHGVIAVLPAKDLIAEDLATDPRDGSRYVSSVREGRVLRLDVAGQWSDFADRRALRAWGIYALAVDAQRGKLWLGSAAGAVSPPFPPAERGRSAVLRVGLESRLVERRYELDDAREHAFGDMALAADGTLFVSDGIGGRVYRLRPADTAQLEPVASPGLLRSPQTPVPLPGGERLMVADYSRGIAVIDLRHGGPPAWLGHPPELALYGIDGLYLHGQWLIAVQNGTAPERLLLLRLDRELTRVASWRVALAGTPGLGDPTHGVIAGRQFQFIANSGWDRVDDAGRMRAAGEAGAPAIWSIDLPE